MGLAVYAGQVYPIWAANFNEASGNPPAGIGLFIYYQPMVIAAGPRIVGSTMGPVAASSDSFTGTLLTGSALVTGLTSTTGLFPGESITGTGIPSGVSIEAVTSLTSITMSADATVSGAQTLTASTDGYQQAEQGSLSFTVTFDRPINPPGTTASFTVNDVQVFYENAEGDGLVPLTVDSVTPVASSGIGPTLTGAGPNPSDPIFGYTEFTTTFDTLPQGDSPTNYNYTGTYSYLITPDDGHGNPIEEPIPSYVYSNVTQSVVSFSSNNVPQPIPSPNNQQPASTGNNTTTSTLAVNGEGTNVITGITVTLSLTAPTATGNQLVIGLTAPDGQEGLVYDGQLFAPAPLDWVNQSFIVDGLAGSKVNGTYTLTIYDYSANNTGGSLVQWSVSIASNRSELSLQFGDAMDQNADGTTDENPLNTTEYPNGYAGLTPGDIYAVPTPNLPSNIATSFFGVTTTGSASVTDIASTSGLFDGEPISGAGIPSGTTIEAVNNPNSITLSAVAVLTGLDVLTVQPVVTYNSVDSILDPVLGSNANTLPLIVSGPQILTTQAVGTAGEVSSGTANLISDDSTSQLNVTFDRPVQVSSFTPSQVLSIMGPTGSILAPQTFGSTSIDQAIPAATATGSGTLDSTLTVNSDNTLRIADITVTLAIASVCGCGPDRGSGGAEWRHDPAIFGRGGQQCPGIC